MDFVKNTRKVKVGGIYIGGSAPVTVQSMLNVPAHDSEGNVRQALALEKAGCDIIRVSVPDKDSLKTVIALKENISVPVVADIHFDWRLAVECAGIGVDKIRINPGNIGDEENVARVVAACKAKNIPIRVGVNSGSVQKDILARFGSATPEALVESGLMHIRLLEKYGFYDTVLSLKSSNVKTMYDAYSLAHEKCDYPLHLGVTEAGTYNAACIKSAAGIGGLLLKGIGDTIRISITGDPVKEVEAGIELLKALNLRKGGIKFISCPTCGRTKVDLIGLAEKAQERFKDIDKDLTVAIMGCVVNGPGEASAADIGIAGGKGCGALFKKGEIIKANLPENKLLDALYEEILKM